MTDHFGHAVHSVDGFVASSCFDLGLCLKRDGDFDVIDGIPDKDAVVLFVGAWRLRKEHAHGSVDLFGVHVCEKWPQISRSNRKATNCISCSFSLAPKMCYTPYPEDSSRPWCRFQEQRDPTQGCAHWLLPWRPSFRAAAVDKPRVLRDFDERVDDFREKLKSGITEDPLGLSPSARLRLEQMCDRVEKEIRQKAK
jgi:hypothetical protein